MAMTTYTGQNYGAGKMDRIKSGIRSGLTIQAILSGVGELAGRSLGGWLAVHFISYTAICYANPIAWGFALGYCIVMVRKHLTEHTIKMNL